MHYEGKSLMTWAWLFLLASPSVATNPVPAKQADYLEFNYGQPTGGDQWIQAIEVQKPELRSAIRGGTRVVFRAAGMTMAKAMCWQQPTEADQTPWGHDATVAAMTLDSEGRGESTTSTTSRSCAIQPTTVPETIRPAS